MRDFLPFLDFIKRYLQTQSQVTTLFGMLLKLALAHAITKVELINENLNDVTLVIHHPFRINLQPAFFSTKRSHSLRSCTSQPVHSGSAGYQLLFYLFKFL